MRPSSNRPSRADWLGWENRRDQRNDPSDQQTGILIDPQLEGGRGATKVNKTPVTRPSRHRSNNKPPAAISAYRG